MQITAIAPWFGSKRTLAPTIVDQLGEHSYYFEACAGSMAVLFAKEPSEHEVVCDLHGALTNLAWVVQDDSAAVLLYDRLQRAMYDDELYAASKDWLAANENKIAARQKRVGEFDPDWAYHYFIASWMGRNGVSGTARVNYQIATRWTKGGGSGPGRFRAAVESIPSWHDRLRNVHVMRRCMFGPLEKLQDDPDCAIYADPPYFHETRGQGKKPGQMSRNGYVHDFTDEDHERLAAALRRFQHARVVVSYYADPRLAKLYQGWTVLDCSRQKHLHVQNKRGMGRKEAPEVLLINGPAFEDSTKKTKPMAAELFV